MIPGVYPETLHYDQPGWCCVCQETAPFYDDATASYFCGAEDCWNQYLADTQSPLLPDDEL